RADLLPEHAGRGRPAEDGDGGGRAYCGARAGKLGRFFGGRSSMGGPDAVAFIVLMVVILGIFKAFFRYMGTRHAAAPPGADAETMAHLSKLEDRVKALEAVVTDQSYQLKEKFREL